MARAVALRAQAAAEKHGALGLQGALDKQAGRKEARVQKAADSAAADKARIDALLEAHGMNSIGQLRDTELARNLNLFLSRTSIKTTSKKRGKECAE